MIVTTDDIQPLKALNYSYTKIARIFISRDTRYQRMEESGIYTECFTEISPPKLDCVVQATKTEHPNAGEVLLRGHLLQQGINEYHVNTVMRSSRMVRRIPYSVPCPNILWHIDGNHKMIRWCLVVHASVDGFSRTIVYIKCANNNRADTVLELSWKVCPHLAHQPECTLIMEGKLLMYGGTCCPYITPFV